ncbi:MAG: heme-binding protein [Mariniblastus sp.]
MVKSKMGYYVAGAVIAGLVFMGWKLTSRNAYESAEYTVIEADGSIELREYPDLMMATTKMSDGVRGNDGSFGRLFQYISGGNEEKQKVAMTTPVFIEPETEESKGQMGFVLPKKVAEGNAPLPANQQVELTERAGGKFAVIRFAGRADQNSRVDQESKLANWIAKRGLESAGDPELASYDPPWTPGPLRRNEILIRIAN